MKYKDHFLVGALLVGTLAGIVAIASAQSSNHSKRSAARDLSALSADHASTTTTTTEPPTTTTTAPPTVELDPVGEAPIQRLTVDLAGTRDHSAPTISVPQVTCTGNDATVRVRAGDNVGVVQLTGQYSSSTQDGVTAVAFAPAGGEWRATVALTRGSAHALTITATDGNGNTRSRTATNLCA